jgi:hypothetical protein
MEVDFTEYLAAADLGWAVVLYLWLMVNLLQHVLHLFELCMIVVCRTALK